jgi:hypothetical protein
MKNQKAWIAKEYGKKAARLAMAGIIATFAVGPLAGQKSVITVFRERQAIATQGKFYCNIKALTPAERAHHTELRRN